MGDWERIAKRLTVEVATVKAERDALRSELAEVKAERKLTWEQAHKRATELIEARARIEELEAAIDKALNELGPYGIVRRTLAEVRHHG